MSRPRLRLLGLLAVLLWATRSAADVCETGKRQSPVNIVGAQKKNLPALDFRYHAQPLQLASDIHTLRLRFAPGSSLRAGAQSYRLHQLHFHPPAGDQIGGETFPMAAHLLHRSSNGLQLAVSEEDNFDLHLVDYEKRLLTWTYGVPDVRGRAPGLLNYPDGVDIDVFRDWKNSPRTAAP